MWKGVKLNDEKRRSEIEEAAYNLLIDKGFKATSMLAVARLAKASNETLYKWYGDKLGLCAAMIERNTKAVEAELITVRADGKVGLEALNSVGKTLLKMVTGNKAVALNRAAAGDPSGRLGALLAKEGRSRVAPQIAELIQQIYGSGIDVRECAETYISLLIGDIQIRRATGAIAAPSKEDIEKRADRALSQLQILYPDTSR